MAHNYEIKEKIVRAGNSTVFNTWHEAAGITMEDFLDGLRWVCDDPMPDGRATRELACIRRPGYGMTEEEIEIWGIPPASGTVGLHRLIRAYYKNGDFQGFFEYDGDTNPSRLQKRFNRVADVASIVAFSHM